MVKECKPCTTIQICNPASGRCVKRDGKTGKQVLASPPKPQPRQNCPPDTTSALADEYPVATPTRKRQITLTFKKLGLGHPTAYAKTTLTSSKFVTTPNKYFILAHGGLSYATFEVPKNTFIVFMTYPGGKTWNPVVSEVLRSEQRARDLIEQKHGLYSVTYYPGDTVQDHQLQFPLNEQGRGVWKVPLDQSFVCRYSPNPRPNNLKYTYDLRKTKKRYHYSMLSEVVRYIRARLDSSDPVVIFCGSCRSTKDTVLYELCKQKNNAACQRAGIPTRDMSLKEAMNRGNSEYNSELKKYRQREM